MILADATMSRNSSFTNPHCEETSRAKSLLRSAAKKPCVTLLGATELVQLRKKAVSASEVRAARPQATTPHLGLWWFDAFVIER